MKIWVDLGFELSEVSLIYIPHAISTLPCTQTDIQTTSTTTESKDLICIYGERLVGAFFYDAIIRPKSQGLSSIILLINDAI